MTFSENVELETRANDNYF